MGVKIANASPALVLIGGPSCAGKTTLARALADELGSERACVLSLDAYYRDFAHLAPDDRAVQNFDAPEAIEWELAEQHVSSFLQGLAVDTPIYDFSAHTRNPGCIRIEPKPVLILDGLLALHNLNLRTRSVLRIFVDAQDAICLARREERDIGDRGRTRESVHEQYARTVRPMAEQYVHPTRVYADIVLDGTGSVNSMVSQLLPRLTNLLA